MTILTITRFLHKLRDKADAEETSKKFVLRIIYDHEYGGDRNTRVKTTRGQRSSEKMKLNGSKLTLLAQGSSPRTKVKKLTEKPGCNHP